MAKTKAPVKPKRDGLTRDLLRAIDHMQDLAPGTVTDIHDAPQTARGTPWRMAVRFIFEDQATTYDDIFVVLRDWRDDRGIRNAVGKDRLARIQVRYRDKKGKGAHGEYTLGEIDGWEATTSRAVERVGIRDGRMESLIARYGSDGKPGPKSKTSYVESLIVWFSPFTDKEIRRGKQQAKKPIVKKKVNKRRRRV